MIKNLLIADDMKMKEKLLALFKIVAGIATNDEKFFKCELRNRPPHGIHLFIHKSEEFEREVKARGKDLKMAEIVSFMLQAEGFEPQRKGKIVNNNFLTHGAGITFKRIAIKEATDGLVLLVMVMVV